MNFDSSRPFYPEYLRTTEIHVQPLTINFITAAVLRVCQFEFEFGTFALNCTLLLGYEAILNTVEAFYWLLLIVISSG